MVGPDLESCEDVLRANALSAPAFQRAVLAALVADGSSLRVAEARPFRARIIYAGAAYEILLDEVFKRYRHGEIDPADAAEEIKAAIGVPGAQVERRGPFPILERRDATAPGAHVLPCPFDDTLSITHIWVVPSGHSPISRSEVEERWGDGTLHALAIDALRKRTEAVPALGEGEGDRLVISYQAGDGLDAAAILLPDLRAEMADWVSGAPRFAIPQRDVLILFGAADAEVVEHMRGVVAGMFEHASPTTRLTPRIFGLDPSGDLIAV